MPKQITPPKVKSGFKRYDEIQDEVYKWNPITSMTRVNNVFKSSTKEVNSIMDEFSGTRPGHPLFYELLEKEAELHGRKNQDYSGDDPLANLRMCEMGGIPAWKGVGVRLSDKMSRILTYMNKGSFEVNDEGLEDTLLDMSVYAKLCLILYREQKNEK